MNSDEVRDYLQRHLAEYLYVLRQWVERDTPSRDKSKLDIACRFIARDFGMFTSQTEIIENLEGGDHLFMQYGGGETTTNSPPILILGHFDTVWPAGTCRDRPYEVRGDRTYGPGIYDMKSGLMIAWYALLALDKFALESSKRPIWMLFTSDEEIGSPTSRALIEEKASQARLVLVLEPPLADGSLKTARKGVGGYTIEVRGRSAHAGVEPEKGANAIVELSHQILSIQSLGDSSMGTTLSVGTVEGGTTPNVVPDRASCRVDARAVTMAEAERIDDAIRSLRPITQGTTLHVSGGFNRPPMERTPAIASLFERAREIGRTLGMELTEGSTGGGSDGNFTAALGIPTLDGLGAMGGGAHAENEHILIDSIPERAALLAALLANL